MNRISTCRGCQAMEQGIKSRIAIPHTCGLEPKSIKVQLFNVIDDSNTIEATTIERHSWGSPVIEKESYCINKIWTCSKCDLIKTASFYRKNAAPFVTFERSGIRFNEHMPECIDWQKENSKTID